MKLALLSLAAVALSLASAATTPKPSVIADCTQEERQTINKLLQQDVNPAKACYAKARGDITTLSTSRLCPLEECRDWLTFMAANTPVCVYDDTNYGRDFRKKDKDCGNPSSSGSGSSAASNSTTTTTKTPKPTPTLSAGSSLGSGAGEVVTTTAPKTKKPVVVSSSSGSGSSFEIEPIERTDAPEVTFEPTVNTPAPTTRAVTPPKSAASPLASTCAAAVTIVVAAALAN
jgi:hypothetical protein